MPNSYPVAVPPSVPVVVYFDPNKTDRGLVQYVNTEQTYYQPLDLGSPHPNTRDYPGFTLGIQQAVDGNEKWIKQIYVSPETNPDWFNYELKFAAEANAFPTFIRQYREDRKTYAPKTKLQPLTAVYKIVLTAEGSGYTPGTLPALTFSGGGGTGAVGHAIVNPDGTLADLVLDDGGTGYTSAPTISVDAPPSGTTATGTAYIQPTSAVLVAEHAEKFPQDSEFFGLCLNVTRVYDTLPGPTLTTTKLDEKDGVVVDVSTTRKLCMDIVTGEDIAYGTWTKTVSNQTEIYGICEEVDTARAIPGFPMQSTQVDPDGIVVSRTQTYKASIDCVTGETLAYGVWDEKHQEDVDGTTLVSWQWEQSRVIPGNPMVVTKIEDDGMVTTTTRTMKAQMDIVSGETVAYGTWTKTYKEDPPIFRGFAIKSSDLVAWEMVETRPLPGNPIPFAKVAGDERVVYGSSTLEDQSLVYGSAEVYGSLIVHVDKEEVSDLVSKKVGSFKKWPPDLKFQVTIPDFIPQRFRGVIPIYGTEYNTPGTAVEPVLGAGELERIESEVNDLLKRISVTSIGDIALPVVLTDTAIDKFCVTTTLVFTFTLGAQTLNPTNDPTFSNGEITHLGANYTLKTEIFDTLPSCYRVSKKPDEDGVIAQTRTRKNLISSITPIESLITGVWTRISQEAENGTIADEVEITRAIPGNAMESDRVDEDGKTVHVVKTMESAATIAAITTRETLVGTTWTKITSEAISDLVAWKIVETRVIPGNAMPSTSIDDDGQVVTVTKTLSESSAVSSGETLVSTTWTRTTKKDVSDLVAQQIVEVRTIPGPEQDGEQTGKWGVEPVSKQKIALPGTIDEGYLIRESKIEPFQGSDLVGTKITVNYPAGLYGVALDGQDYDPRLNTVIPYVQKLQPISSGIGTNFEDITPEDYHHANVRTIDPTTVAAVLDAYVFSYPGRINVDMPDLLTAITAVIESSTSDGADQEVGSNTLSGSGSVAQSLTAQSQASANILPEAWPTIKQFWGNNIACQHYHFFLPTPATSAEVLAKLEAVIPGSVSNWPKYNPELVTIVMTGGRVSVQAKAHSQGSYATSGSGTASTAGGGTGYSEERGLTIKTLRISPTIHNEIILSVTGPSSESVSATAYAEAAGLGPLESQGTGPLSVYGTVSPTTVAASYGDTAWPTSGLYLYRTDPHPYRYGYIEFHCVVVDAADFPNV